MEWLFSRIHSFNVFISLIRFLCLVFFLLLALFSSCLPRLGGWKKPPRRAATKSSEEDKDVFLEIQGKLAEEKSFDHARLVRKKEYKLDGCEYNFLTHATKSTAYLGQMRSPRLLVRKSYSSYGPSCSNEIPQLPRPSILASRLCRKEVIDPGASQT